MRVFGTRGVSLSLAGWLWADLLLGLFNIVVFDASTGRPLNGVCVVVGTASCVPGAPHTDASGRWSADIPVTAATTDWDMSFIKTGYVTLKRKLQLVAGGTVTYQIFLRRS